jgi:hypothetical protein
MSAGGTIMKTKTGLKAGQDRNNTATVTVTINQNSGDDGSAG